MDRRLAPRRMEINFKGGHRMPKCKSTGRGGLWAAAFVFAIPPRQMI